ncbi:MAG: hypothetical protein MSK46_03430 [Bacteroidales bacterium]|nr:hypothetical protein [Bacteroidales bacterium]
MDGRRRQPTDAKPRAESSLLGYAEARRRKTKSTDGQQVDVLGITT